MDEKPKGDWTANEAGDYAKHCSSEKVLWPICFGWLGYALVGPTRRRVVFPGALLE